MTETEPTTLGGRYRLIVPIAAGGMSVIWRGHDDVLARPIAVKLLSSVPTDGTDAERVRREAMAVARISHPYIANVYDYGESADPSGTVIPYIVMELVEGSSLAQVLSRGPLSWPTAAGICAQVAAALSAAHHLGVVHRDVTPSNIMLCVDGVKVVDFGISAPAGQAADPHIFGTPAYLAPERLSGAPVQPATDIYGLGLVLYQMIAGHLPWPSETATQMLDAHRYAPPAPLPPILGMPSRLTVLCQRSLAVDPGTRPTASELSVELAAIARAGDPRARPTLVGTAPSPTVPASAGMAHGPTGTRILPHGTSALVDPTAMTVITRSAPPFDGAAGEHVAGAAVRRRREPGMFVLPAVLLALLVGCLAWASLHQSDQAATAPRPAPSVTAPRLIAPAPSKPSRPRPATTTCQVDYQLMAQWIVGFTAQVTIVNTGTAAIDDWTLRFDLQPGQRVGGGWNGQWDQDGSTVTVRGASYNQEVPIGGQVTIGFLGTQDRNTSETPQEFHLNGTACA